MTGESLGFCGRSRRVLPRSTKGSASPNLKSQWSVQVRGHLTPNNSVVRGPMARNIEIKAHVESIEALAAKAAAIADEGPIEIIQDDTFFRCESGRLKLRAFSSEEGELIFYRRANQRGPKESFYLRSP